MQSQQLNSPSISQASSTNRIYKHFSDADRRSSELVTYLNKLPVALNHLLKAVKKSFPFICFDRIKWNISLCGKTCEKLTKKPDVVMKVKAICCYIAVEMHMNAARSTKWIHKEVWKFCVLCVFRVRVCEGKCLIYFTPLYYLSKLLCVIAHVLSGKKVRYIFFYWESL